jgi:hypothetical protein
MRKKVRGLRDIERAVLEQRRERQAEQGQARPEAAPVEAVKAATAGSLARSAAGARAGSAEATGPEMAPPPPSGGGATQTPAGNEAAEQVVLDYCCVVRGILNDDQGGPLHPPGLRMAEALAEVQESLQRNLALNKPGPAHGQLAQLVGCIESGLASVKAEQEAVRQQVKEIAKVEATLEQESGTRQERRARYEKLQRQYQAQGGAFYDHLARLMKSWQPGLFLGPRAKKGEKGLEDNLELERWFRKPKRHERQIHGRRHAGVRIVQEGPTLVLVLGAHEAHPGPFTAEELLAYWPADEPHEQQEALQRRRIMRQARSKKNETPCSEI